MQSLRDLQLANHIESRAIRLRQESLSRLIIMFAGTQASGFVKFIVDAFGSSKEMSEAEASELMKIPGEGGDDEDDEEEVVLSTKDPSAPVTSLPDVCSLADSKPAYPVSSTQSVIHRCSNQSFLRKYAHGGFKEVDLLLSLW